ncbi:hypothetical protein Pmani_035046 [Petrolisthes manimaculis]|uniref:Uncharacterized protein n=1 Tax=Petrolisthes manimaculis TaxID=1843537 RepID=A0AAE1NN37_9EUCA|nr:hypothetical protein Pmani_035046 [Petrolisthes manimaculis]
MSVICQTFVQNTWRKDLCSNCFKSKEEHGAGGGGGGGGGLFGGSNTPGGDIRGGGGGGGISQRDGSVGEDRRDRPQHYTSIGKNGMDGGGFGVGGLGSSGTRGGSKRYVGVAERVYRRGYYPQNSWKSLVIDKNDSSHSERLSSTTSHTNTNTTSSCSALTSPALIRGMSTSLVSHENEKNLKLSDLGTSSDLLRCSRLVRQVRSSTDQLLLTPSPCTTQSQARILTQLLGEDRKDPHENEDRRGRREVEEDVRRSEDKEDFEKGDVSSDLGSEASHDSSNSQMSSPSSSSSSSSYHTSHSAPDSDTGSIKSDNNDDEDDLYREEQMEEEKKKRDEDAKRSSRVTLLRGSRVTRSSSPTSSPPPPPPPSTQPPLPHVSFPLFPASRSVSASSLYSPPTPLPTTTTTTTTTTITSQSVVPSFSVTSSTPTSRSLSTSPTSTHITTTTSSSSSTSSSSLSSSLTSRSLTSSSSHSTPSSRSLTSSSSISTSASRSLTSSSTLTTPTPTSRSLPSTVFTSSPPTHAPTTTTPYSTPTQSPTSSPPVRTPATAPSSTPTTTSKPTPTTTSKPTPTTTSKPTPTNTTKPTPTYTSKPTPTYTSKPTPTTTSNPTLTNTSKPTPTTTTSNPTPTYTSKPTPTYTSKPTPTTTSKPTPTNTAKPTPTNTAKPTPTYTSNPTPTNSSYQTPTTTSKPTPTYTTKPTPTTTSNPTLTNTSKPTPTYTSNPTPTNTSKPTPTYTTKPTPTTTSNPTLTNTSNPTPTNTSKQTPTNSSYQTPTITSKPTPTNTSKPTPTYTTKPTPTTTSKPTLPSPTSHPAPPPPTTTTTTTTSTVPSSSVSAPPPSSSPISTTTTPSSPASATPSVTQPPAAGILKKAKEGNKRPGNKRNNNNNSPLRRGITFNPKLEKVIGFGGDVDYSDDEDDYDDDDDDEDDEDYDDPSDLTPDERVLRQLTMKNTDFNSDNDNLKKDIPEDELLPSVEELEAKRKIIIAEIEALERLGRERAKKEQEGDKTQQEKAPTEACKQEGKVKLKRSPPLVTTKPLIARSSSTEPRVNQVLPMKNGEVVRPGGVQVEAGGGNGGKVGGGLLENEVAVEEAQEEEEEVPLKGIKPKYVSREEEMVEKEVQEDEVKLLHKPVGRVKVTAIDDVCKEKVTVIDEVVCTKQVNDVSTKKTRSSGVGDVLCTKRVTLNDDDVSGKRETPIMTDSSMKKGTSADDSSTKNVTSTSDSKRVGPKHDVSKAMSAKSDKDQDNAISTHKQTLSDNTITSKKPDSQTSKSTNSGASDKPQQQTRPSSDPRLQTNSLTPSSKSNKSEARQPSSSGGSKPSSISATPRTSLANDTSKPQQQQQQKSENAAATLVRGDDNTKPGLLNERDTTSASFTTTPITTNTTTSSSSYRKQGSESVGVSEGDTCSSAVNPNTSPTIVSSSSTTTTHPRKSEAKASVISEGTSGKEVNRQVAQDSTTTPKCKTASSIAKTVTTTLSTTTTTTTKGTVNAVTKKTVVTGKSLSAPPPTTVQNSTTTTTTTKSQSSSSDPRRRLSNLALTHDSVVSVSQAESSPKTPASRQGSNSSLMSTFGTPVIITTSQSSTSAASSPSSSSSSSSFQQNSSFLHSSPARGMYDDVYSCPSNVMIPSTPDFLREIRAPAEVQSPTAGIQKSGLYASTSCLKGIPGSKPVITPKPPTLKDKPKLPMKPPPSSSRIIYATPAPVNPKVPIGSFSMSSPNLAGMGGEMKEDSASSTSSLTSSSSTGRSEAGKQLPPPTTQAPAVPRSEVNGSSRCKEAVYDVPVTLSSSALSSSSSHASPSLSSTSSRTSITTTSSSPKSPSTTSSSTDTNKKVDDVTIYHEIDDSIKSTTTTATLSTITSAVTRHESTRCQPRSTFEANRSMLSAALDMRAARSSPGKRLAPIPPEDENEEQAGEVPSEDQPKQIASPAVEGQQQQQQQQQQGLSTLHLASMTPSQDSQGTDGGSYSSFTDDFDDDDDEEDEVMGARSQEDVATMRKSERSISAAPLYRNSIGPILSHHEIEGTHFATPSPTITNTNNNTTNTIQSPVPALPPPAVVVMCPTGDSVSSRHSPATRSHSVPRTNEYLVSLSGDGGGGLPGLGGSSSSAASSSSSSSKFSFGRSGFFRPSSPPSVKRGSSTSSERGRDRKAKKTPSSSSSSSSSSSKFSLKKLLRLGGGGKEEERRKKEGGRGKEEEKRLARETRKGKLTIIHPLDYNQNGVEVIARPEKTSPIYDYTGIYGYVPPPRPIPDSFSPCPTPQPTSGLVQASPAPSQASRGSSEASSKEGVKVRNGGEKSTDENGYATPSVQPSTVYASSTTGIPGVSVPSTCTPNTAPSSAGSGSSNSGAGVEKRNSFLRKDSTCVERRESAASQSSRSSGSNSTQHHLGYNSEGDVRAPITPRKPGRTSSIRGEDDREKRRAPQPPAAFQQSGQEEEEEEVGIHYKANKGPAPNTPSYQLQEDVQSSRAVRRVSSGVRRSAPSAPLAPRSLRDQYGAVISANMDALANFLDQLSTTPHQPEFEKLNHWNEIRTEEQAVAEAGQRVFYVGSTRGRCVTIMVTPEPKVDTHHLLGPLPLANFKDELPRHLLYQGCVTRGKTIPGTVWVLPALDLVSLEQLSVEVTGAPTTAPWLVLLQLVTGLKQLQARGVEETHLNLTLVARGSEGEGYDPHPTLIIVPPSDSDGDVMSLCQCAAAATNILLHGVDGEANREDPSSLPPPAPLLLHLLHQERSGSLTQVKRVLEVLLFGPDNWPGEDVDDHDSDPEDSQAAEEAALERWLDLERAKLLHTLTRGPPASRVLAKFHLLFLIRANPRALRETLALLGQPEVTEF